MKKLLIIMLLVASPCLGVKKLVPGDIVKGKVIDKTYYAYSVAEQAELMHRLRVASKTEELVKSQNKTIDYLKQEVSLLKSYNSKYTTVIASYSILTNRAYNREKEYSSLSKTLIKRVKLERSRRKKSFLIGILTTLATSYYLKR